MADVKILLTAKDQASKEINKTTQSVDKLGKEIKTTDKETQKFQKTQSNSKQSSQGMAKAFTAAGIAVAAITKGMQLAKDAIVQGIEKFKVQEQAEAQLNAVLESTGYAAGLTAEQLKNMASELQQVSTFGDEAIIRGQNLLLTFTNISGDVFPRTTQAMVDMSAAMGQDMKSSAIQLGKALNDPLKGMSALSKVGVSFTDEEKALIQTMTEAGDTAAAQGVILSALEMQFGGAAAAIGDTFSGSLDKLKNNLGDVQEDLGRLAMAVGSGLVKELNEAVLDIREFFSEMTSSDTAINAIASLSAGMTVLFDVLKELAIGPTKELIQTFMEIGDEVSELFGGTQDLSFIFMQFQGNIFAVMTVTRSVLFVFKTLVNVMVSLGKTVKEFAQFFKDSFDSVAAIAKSVFSAMKGDISFKEAFDNIRNTDIPNLTDDFENMTQDLGAVWKDFGTDVADDAKKFSEKTKESFINTYTASQEMADKAAESYNAVAVALKNAETDAKQLMNTTEELEDTIDGSTDAEKEQYNALAEGFTESADRYREMISQQDKAKEKAKETAEAIKDGFTDTLNIISEVASGVSDVVNELYQRNIDALTAQNEAELAMIDERLQAELEARGLAELSKLDQAYLSLEELRKQLAEETDAEKKELLKQKMNEQRNEIEKQKLIEQANAEKEAANKAYQEKLYKQEVEQFKVNQGLSIAEVWIKAAQAVVSTWAGYAAMGPFGAIAAGIQTGAILTLAGVQTGVIASQSPPSKPAFATGGIVPGTSYTGDNVAVQANSREMILNMDQQKNIFDMINNGGMGGNIAVNVYLDGSLIQDYNYSVQRQRALLV